MLSPPLRQTLVIISFFPIAAVAMYPHRGGPIREFPIVAIALLGALAVHALARSRPSSDS